MILNKPNGKVAELLALKCTNCGGHLEVNSADVDLHTQTAVLKQGMVLKCPHCDAEYAAGVQLPRHEIVQNVGGINITAGNNININVNGNVISGNKAIRASRRAARREQSNANIDHNCMMRLYHLVAEHFNLEELEELCFELDVNYEDIAGNTRSAKARNIVLYAKRRRCMFDLLDACDGLRSEIDWPTWDEMVGRAPAHPPQPQTTTPAPTVTSAPHQPVGGTSTDSERQTKTVSWFSKIKTWWKRFRSAG